MASNGYVRRCCTRCIFYRTDQEIGDECILYDETWNANGIRWVSATDYHRDPYIRAKHDEECEHFSDKKEIRNKIREKFGIKLV